jgi:N-acetylmuramoyl-L-alanine amidase
MRIASFVVPLALALVALGSDPAAAQSARTRYENAQSRERSLHAIRHAAPPLSQLRGVARSYEQIAHRYPRSGYADNALYRGALVALEAHRHYRQKSDREAAVKMLNWVVRAYPSSSIADDARDRLRSLEPSRAARRREPPPKPTARAAATTVPSPRAPAKTPPAEPVDLPEVAESREDAASAATDPPAPLPAATLATLKAVRRLDVDDVVRVTMELDREVTFHQEELAGPKRLFFDLRGTRAAPDLGEALRFADAGVIREVRLGERPDEVTRVVIDTEHVERYSVFALYNPYRLVIDFKTRGAIEPKPFPTTTARRAPTTLPRHTAAPATLPAEHTPEPRESGALADVRTPVAPPPDVAPSLPTRAAAPTALPAPRAPETNGDGGFSLARQLGLGVSRVVIDPGHGGHDPGAMSKGLSESELVLDVALRLEQLLRKQGVDVVLTRRTDKFVPLEERTAMANRHRADLFLSIHANSSRNRKARGIETYFLNFATSKEAEEVAARENAASGQAMRNLPDIVKAIALNTKLDESRDLAEMVQDAMVDELREQSSEVHDLGVKQAPFVVLIGAGMPSVLAEISFVSHAEEARLLKTSPYRQRIAQALGEAVLRYQKSLKSVGTVASQLEP